MLDNEEKTLTKSREKKMCMLCWISRLTLKDRIRNDHDEDNLKIAPLDDKLRETRLRWFAQVSRGLETALVCRVERS